MVSLRSEKIAPVMTTNIATAISISSSEKPLSAAL
jgi:hypothetical protein